MRINERGIYNIKYVGEKSDLIRVTDESYNGMCHGIRLRPMLDSTNEQMSSGNYVVALHDRLIESVERVQ